MLVVDDNNSNLYLMQEIFSHFHIAAELASTAEQAIAKVKEARQKKEPFNLVITDHLMPGMNGIALVKEMKKLFPAMKPSLYPDAVFSGKEHLPARVRAKAGINKFLSKPVKMHELYGALLSLFEMTLQQDGQHFQVPGATVEDLGGAYQHHGRR